METFQESNRVRGWRCTHVRMSVDLVVDIFVSSGEGCIAVVYFPLGADGVARVSVDFETNPTIYGDLACLAARRLLQLLGSTAVQELERSKPSVLAEILCDFLDANRGHTFSMCHTGKDDVPTTVLDTSISIPLRNSNSPLRVVVFPKDGHRRVRLKGFRACGKNANFEEEEAPVVSNEEQKVPLTKSSFERLSEPKPWNPTKRRGSTR